MVGLPINADNLLCQVFLNFLCVVNGYIYNRPGGEI